MDGHYFPIIPAFIGSAVVLFVYLSRFNIWAPNEKKPKSANPPRYYTSFGSYMKYALVYAGLFEAMYAFIILFPDLTLQLIEIAKKNNWFSIEGFDPKSFKENGVLWATIIVAAILPNLHKSINIDYFFRKMLHKRAFIPTEAYTCIKNFTHDWELFQPDTKVVKSVIEKQPESLMECMFHIKENVLDHKWAKLSYMMFQLNKWSCWPQISRSMEGYAEERDELEASYKELSVTIDNYYRHLVDSLHQRANEKREQKEGAKLKPDELTRILQAELNRKIDLLFEQLYQIISCGALVVLKTPAQREQSYQFFGLQPQSDQCMPVDRDTILTIVGMVFLVTLFPAMIYFSLYDATSSSVPVPKDYLDTLKWAVISLLLHGGAVFLSAYINRFWMNNFESGKQAQRKYHYLKPSIFRRVVCAVAGYFAGALVLVGFVMIGERPLLEVLDKLWQWPFLSAVTGYFIAYYFGAGRIKSLSKDPNYRKRLLKFGLIQGGVSAGVGVLAVLFFLNQKIGAAEMPFLIFVASMSFIIGMSIGYLFPDGYRKLEKENNRRRVERTSIREQADVLLSGETIPCQIRSISLTGATIDKKLDIASETDDLVSIRSQRIGELMGKIIRFDNTGTHIQFLLDHKSKERLSEFIKKVA